MVSINDRDPIAEGEAQAWELFQTPHSQLPWNREAEDPYTEGDNPTYGSPEDYTHWDLDCPECGTRLHRDPGNPDGAWCDRCLTHYNVYDLQEELADGER